MACDPTTAGQVASSALIAVLFGVLLAGFVYLREHRRSQDGIDWRKPSLRRVSWGGVVLFLAGGAIALLASLVMAIFGVTFGC